MERSESSVNYKAIEARVRLRDVEIRMGQLILEKMYWEEQLAMAEQKKTSLWPRERL